MTRGYTSRDFGLVTEEGRLVTDVPKSDLPEAPTVDLSKFTTEGHDRGRGTLTLVLWWLTKIAFIQSRLPWPSGFRRLLLVAFGAKIGQGFYIRPSVNIHFPWRLTIGNNVWLGEGSTILNLAEVKIEDNVAIAHEVYIAAAGHSISDEHFAYSNQPVIVEAGAWLATRSYVGPGVVVGRGAVVAAGAVVVSDVAAGAIVGGVPARQIGRRELKVAQR